MDIKAPTREERIAYHKRGVKMVLVAVLMGVLAGVLSSPLVLSQPIYQPVVTDGASVFSNNPIVILNDASIVQANDTVMFPDASALFNNASVVQSNVSAVIPNATATHANALITLSGASVTHNNASVLLKNVSVSTSNGSDIQANTSILLTSGLILLPAPTDTQNSTSVFLSYWTHMQTNRSAPNHANFSILILVIAIYLQKFILPRLGIDSSKFGFKDWVFIGFMTLFLWFITWTILLNGPAPPVGPLF